MSRTSDPVQPSRPRPVLLLALAVGAVLVYALQGLVPLLMDGEVPRPDELLAPPSPVVLGGPIAWAAALAVLVLPRGRAHPLATTAVGTLAYVAGLALGAFVEIGPGTGGWNWGWESVVAILLVTGVWVPALVAAAALAWLARPRRTPA